MNVNRLKAHYTAQLLKQQLEKLRQKWVFYRCWRIKNQIIISFHQEQYKTMILETLAKVIGCQTYSLLFEYRVNTNHLRPDYKIIIHQHEHLYPGITQIMQVFFENELNY